MPLGINNQDLFTNAQFQQFVEFAQTSKAGSIAQTTTAPLVPDGKPHSIAGTTENWFSKLIRSSAAKEANNYTRTIFRDSIAKMFGGENNIPDSVKDAMKMADYDKGKPLTARRILAVKAAIDQVADKMNSGLQECVNKYSKSKNLEQIRPLLEKAFTACNGNADAMDIVKAHISKIVYTGTSDLRTTEQVQEKVDALVANLNELKTATKKNPGIYAAGKDLLMDIGKALPKGVLTKLAQAANELPVDSLRKLSGSTSGMAMHKTLMQLYKTLNKAMVSSGAEKLMEGAEELQPARQFLVTAMLSRVSKSALGKIRGAIGSDTTKILTGFYNRTCSKGHSTIFENETNDLQLAVDNVGDIGKSYLSMLNNGVNFNMRRFNPADQPTSVLEQEGQLFLGDIGGEDLVADTISMAKDLIAANVEQCIDQTVTGSGKGAETFKQLLRNKLDGAIEPGQKLGACLSTNANAMMNWNICGEMKKIVTGQECQFKKDIYRGTNVTLSDGKNTFKLTMKFETARDELAQFVTGDPKATYEGLTEAEDKTKVHLLMALLSQETEKAAQLGTQIALEPRESDEAFGEWFISDQQSRSYTVEKRSDGGIELHYVMDNPLTDIKDNTTNNGLNDEITVGEGSKHTCKLDYTLKGAEFNRLAKLDFGKFDDSEGAAFFREKEDMPDGTRQFHENKLERTVDTFAQEFKVNADCKMDISMILQPSDEELIAAQQ